MYLIFFEWFTVTGRQLGFQHRSTPIACQGKSNASKRHVWLLWNTYDAKKILFFCMWFSSMTNTCSLTKNNCLSFIFHIFDLIQHNSKINFNKSPPKRLIKKSLLEVNHSLEHDGIISWMLRSQFLRKIICNLWLIDTYEPKLGFRVVQIRSSKNDITELSEV